MDKSILAEMTYETALSKCTDLLSTLPLPINGNVVINLLAITSKHKLYRDNSTLYFGLVV